MLAGESAPARRFISSILGGDVPYGSRGHALQRALPARPEAPAAAKPERLELPRPTTPPRTPRPEPPTRVSVIQRVPPKAQSARRDDTKIEIPRSQEPEQVSPSSSSPFSRRVRLTGFSSRGGNTGFLGGGRLRASRRIPDE